MSTNSSSKKNLIDDDEARNVEIDVKIEVEVPEGMSEEVAEEIAEKLADEVAEGIVEEMAEGIVEEMAEGMAEEIVEEMAEELADEIVEEAAEELAEEVAEEMTEELNEEMVELSEMMFHPEGKNPYYLNDKALNNLQDLVDNLDAFTGNEGPWVAAWLEYLGDEDVAARIQNWPDDFKQIVIARYNKLKDHHSCAICD